MQGPPRLSGASVPTPFEARSPLRKPASGRRRQRPERRAGPVVCPHDAQFTFGPTAGRDGRCDGVAAQRGPKETSFDRAATTVRHHRREVIIEFDGCH
jgi:hypothetical protein